MFWTRRPDRLLLDGARVGCPIRGGDVEIDDCFACGKLLRVIDDDPPYVRDSVLKERDLHWRTTLKASPPVLA